MAEICDKIIRVYFIERMKKMKKGFLNQISRIFVSTVFIGSVVLPMLNIDVFAARKATETYDLNDDISYTYKDVDYDGEFDTLIIKGDGAMPAFKNVDAPWCTERYVIEEVIIEDGIKSISDNAFYMFDMLKEISIPDSVRTIGEGAFYKCVRLKEIDIPDSVHTIGGNAFGGCSALETITIPEDVTEIERGTFTYCLKLKKVIFEGDDIEDIGMTAFHGCSALTEIEIPDGVERIRENAFSSCKELKKVTIPESVTRIDSNAFENCVALRQAIFDCRSSLEYSEKWGFDEKYFIKEHNYKNGVCTVCYEKEKSTDDDDDTEYTDWDDIIENTENTFGTTTYDVNMGSRNTVVPYDVFNVLKGKNAVLNIKVDDTFSWSIKGKEITTPKELDLGVKIADTSIPLTLIDDYTKAFNYTEIELSESGNFGLKAELTIDVGTINNGKKVDLYYYDGDELEFIANSEVKNGKVTLPFTHASRYILDIYSEQEESDDDSEILDFAAGESAVVTEIIL